MSVKIQPLDKLNEEAFHLLTRELGVANTARFLRQFTTGSGNYTEERRELFKDQTLDDLLVEIHERRSQNARSERERVAGQHE
jgi:hypothetical protein